MDSPSAQIVNLGFTVADGEHIKTSCENQTLRVSFVNWQDQNVTFVCHDTIAYRWQEAEYFLSDQERYDSCHEILNSPWLRLHKEQSMTWEGAEFHHYKLNFDAAGILEMICSSIELLSSES